MYNPEKIGAPGTGRTCTTHRSILTVLGLSREMSKPCIVCVDEEPARLERLAALIEQRFGETHQLRCYSSSEECLEGLVAMAKENPQLPAVPLVLCDESMHQLIVQLERHRVRLANVVSVRSG